MNKEFDRDLFVSNIAFLLENKKIRIGDFESSTGVYTGYFSRIAKESGIKPGLEFVFNASEFLGVSLDLLLKCNLRNITNTELYFLEFIEKLIADTNDEKLYWKIESASYLNELTTDLNGNVEHPLFEEKEIGTIIVGGYPSAQSDVRFCSDSFGLETIIAGDCFTLQLPKKGNLYLMNVADRNSDKNSSVRELWICSSDWSKTFVGSTKANSYAKEQIAQLFDILTEYVRHPHLQDNIRTILDMFMRDEDEPEIEEFTDETIPF